MKHFTEREKRIINGILHGVAYDTYVLTNAFMDILDNHGIAFDSKTKCLLFDAERKYEISDILQVERDFIETALLIQYLIDNQYIYIIKDNNEPPLSVIGDKSKNPIAKEVPEDIAAIFIKTQNRIVAMNKLYDLVRNNFTTYEEQQLTLARQQLDVAIGALEEARKQSKSAKTTMWLSVVAIVIAILTLLATIFIPSCSHCGDCSQLVTSVDTIDLKSVIGIDSIHVQLEKINENILLIISQNNHLTNNFSLKPNVTIGTQKCKAPQKKKKCLSDKPVLKIDTINCGGETYWVLPCPPSKISTNNDGKTM